MGILLCGMSRVSAEWEQSGREIDCNEVNGELSRMNEEIGRCVGR